MTTKKKRLLVINDDPDLVAAMSAILVDAGYDVLGTAHRLFDEVLNTAPDLVLLDVPPHEEKEGVNFIQRMRLEPKTAKIPILLGTTSLKHLEPQVLRDKMIFVLVRPFEVEELLKAVEELVVSAEQRG